MVIALPSEERQAVEQAVEDRCGVLKRTWCKWVPGFKIDPAFDGRQYALALSMINDRNVVAEIVDELLIETPA